MSRKIKYKTDDKEVLVIVEILGGDGTSSDL